MTACMDRSARHALHLLLPVPALVAAFAAVGCRDSDRAGPGERPALPAERAAALAARSDPTGPAAGGTTTVGSETRAGMGLEAVRAAVRGLVMLQETIGETTTLRTLLPEDPTGPPPDGTAVRAALENLHALVRMEAAGAAALGLDDVAPLLDRTAQAVARWTAGLAPALESTDDGASLAVRLSELPGRLRAADDELRALREARRTALEASLPALATDDRRRAACLAAAADALYAWDLARRALEPRARAAATQASEPGPDGGPSGTQPSAAELWEAGARARTATTVWRDFVDAGYPVESSAAPVADPLLPPAATAADATAREACRGMTINALPPPGEDVPGPPAGTAPRRPPS